MPLLIYYASHMNDLIGNSVDNSNSNNDSLLALIVLNSSAVHPQSIRVRLHPHRSFGCQ